MNKIIFYAVVAFCAACMSSCGNDDAGTLAVKLDKTSIELVKGDSLQLNATVLPEGEDAEIYWYSEDEAYVKVDQSGLVTAVALKKVEDEAESEDDEDENALAVSVFALYQGGAAECEVTVLPLEPSAISLVPAQHSMRLGEQVLLQVEYTPEDVDIKEVEWSTSMAAVATVKDGVVTAKGYGTCEIIANYGRVEARTYILVLQ